MKVMILAAGRGERLKPYTDHTPKPLVTVGNTTLIDHILVQLRVAGVSEVVINVHYLREQIMQHCGNGAAGGIKIQYSVEENLLETGGGITKALPLLGEQPFLVVSADIWTDYPFSQLLRKQPSSAHLVLVENPAFHLEGDYCLDALGCVLPKNIEKKPTYTYASFGVFHPDLFQGQKPMPFPLSKLLNTAIEARSVRGELYQGLWHNVTSVAELMAISK